MMQIRPSVICRTALAQVRWYIQREIRDIASFSEMPPKTMILPNLPSLLLSYHHPSRAETGLSTYNALSAHCYLFSTLYAYLLLAASGFCSPPSTRLFLGLGSSKNVHFCPCMPHAAHMVCPSLITHLLFRRLHASHGLSFLSRLDLLDLPWPLGFWVGKLSTDRLECGKPEMVEEAAADTGE